MSQKTSSNKSKKTIYGPCALVVCSTETGTWRVVRPVVDHERCVLCGMCEKHCPTGVVTTGKEEDGGTLEIDYTYCKGCGICANICPKNSIEMVDEREA